MRRERTWQSLAFVIFGAVSLSRLSEATEELRLTVSISKTSYSIHEGILDDGTLRIDAMLTNTSPASIYISNEPFEVICPTTVTRNGVAVPRVIGGGGDYLDGSPPPSDDLVELKPGASSRLKIEGLQCAPFGTVTSTIHYRQSSPGRYTVKFRYRYYGLDWGHTPVYRGEVESNEITFTIRPPGK